VIPHIISGSTRLLFFFQKEIPLLSAERRTPWSVRAFRDGDYAGGITHGIGSILSFDGRFPSKIEIEDVSSSKVNNLGKNCANLLVKDPIQAFLAKQTI